MNVSALNSPPMEWWCGESRVGRKGDKSVKGRVNGAENGGRGRASSLLQQCKGRKGKGMVW